MSVGRWGRVRRYGLWSGVPAVVAGVAAWAALADGKHGWTIVAAGVTGAVGAFGPTVADRRAAAQERRQLQADAVTDVRVAGLPVSVTWLLRPDQHVVPFFGRGWLLRRLEVWATDRDAVAVRLLIGAGGVGKTRLAREFASRLPGWECEWIHPEAEAETAGLIRSGTFGPRSLLVLDYAEARDRVGVAGLLYAAQQSGDVRVLLLARAAGLWWETLSAAFPQQAHLVDAMTGSAGAVIEVSARVDDVHNSRTIAAEATAAFAKRLGRPVPILDGVREWPAETPVLRLHADALAAVLDGAHRQGDYDVLSELLGHESRYWRYVARKVGLAGDADDEAADAGLWQLAGIAALVGADTTDEVAGLVSRAPLIADADTTRAKTWVSWLSRLYPTESGLGGVQPDLLAETLAVRVLRDCTADEQARVFAGLSARQAVRVLTVLGRARVHQADVDVFIDVALGADVPRMVEAVVEVGVQFPGVFTARVVGLLATAEMDQGWARRIAERVPYPSLELGPLALALTTRIVTGLPHDAAVADRASWITAHAIRLAGVGRLAEALTACGEAVAMHRELTGQNRDAHLHKLALSVSNHAVGLSKFGRQTEALAASEEAVDLYRELVRLNRDASLPGLARSLNNHAATLADAGRVTKALAASEEALTLFRELTGHDREAHLDDFAGSVHNHALRLAALGRRAAALAASEEAVDLYRELVQLNRDGYLPALALSLWSAGCVSLKVGRVTKEFIALTLEGVTYFETLIAAEPAVFTDLHRAAVRTLARLHESEQSSRLVDEKALMRLRWW